MIWSGWDPAVDVRTRLEVKKLAWLQVVSSSVIYASLGPKDTALALGCTSDVGPHGLPRVRRFAIP